MKASASRKIWFAYFSALLVWALYAYAYTFDLLEQHKLFALYVDGRPYVSDFVNTYSASLLSLTSSEGLHAAIYNPDVQMASVKALIAPVVPELTFYFQYPPFFFVLVSPLAQLGLLGAYWSWCAIGTVGIVLSVSWLMRRRSEFDNWRIRAFIWVAVFCSFPVWFSFKLGQTSLVLLPVVIAFWLLLRSKRWAGAAIATAACMIKFQYLPLIFVSGLCLAALHSLKSAVKYICVLLAMILIMLIGSVAKLGWANVAAYPAALLNGETSKNLSGVSGILMQNVRGQLALLTGSDTAEIKMVSVIVLFLASLATAWLWLKIYPGLQKSNPQAFDICASLSTLSMLVVSPHAHIQDYLLALLPCIWLWSALRDRLNKPKSLATCLIIGFPVLSWLFYLLLPGFAFIRIQPFFLWAVMLMSCIMFEFFLNHSQTPDVS